MDIHKVIDGPHNLIPTSAGCIGLLILLTYVFNNFVSKGSRVQRKLPPGPSPKPLIGNLLDMPPAGKDASPHYLMLGEKYGPIMSFNVFGQTIVAINKYSIAKELLDKRSSNYSNRPESVFGKDLCGYERGMIFEQANDNFRQMRKFSHAHIGSPMALNKWRKEIDLETRRYLRRVLEQPQDFAKHVRTEAASIILRILYGYQTSPDGSDQLVELIEQVMVEFSDALAPGKWLVDVIPALRHIPGWIPGAGFQRIARKYYDNLTEVLDLPFNFVQSQIKSGTARPSLVSEALERGESNKTLTVHQESLLKGVSFALFAGGSDTTVIIMEVFFLAILQHPHVLARAQAEIDHVLGSTRLPEPDDQDRLPYCTAIVKETLRWNPIGEIVMPHVSSQDDQYEDYFIPKGTMVLANLKAFLHDPEVYADPTAFKPERFVGPTPERDVWDITWGFGKRICPGRFLAFSNLWLEISRTIACFDIKPVKGHEPTGEFTVGFLRRPLPFKADITVRSGSWDQLIREVDVTDPLPEKGDDEFLCK